MSQIHVQHKNWFSMHPAGVYLHVIKCNPCVLSKLLTEHGNLGITLTEMI